jgi:hypothetical protein
MSTLAVDALGGDDRLRSRGQPATVTPAAATAAANVKARDHALLATPRTV